ncbi:cysteine dioxygenase [Vibrio methylphosphonaticus]|uniref:cysteine dioxygenase n=1 Tax=Vibrio methylphosphonaticus TaxID=2946866 RepID=UPI00202A088F|nr:cysteine dioxygenase family protein [Vibrio methylphosphonaticus]MCL9773770.1 cysteine dioxygenase family protein [Vibrio methylphosphonaticus]
MSFSEFISQVQDARRPLSLAVIRFLLDNVTLSKDEVKSLASFEQDHYSRKRLFRNEHCEILILSWLSGQRSKIHDHRGTACGVKILLGDATETEFQIAANGHIYATQSALYRENTVTVSRDQDIHQISNLQSDSQPLVTLHIYSPPLKTFYLYELDGTEPELLDVQDESWFYEI